MRLKLKKFVFRVTTGKFLGFMLTTCGIEVNHDKYVAILNMMSPKNL